MKNYILDTNVILNDAHSIFKFSPGNVIIPAIVLEEINNKKSRQDVVGRNAREFSRLYMELREKYPEDNLSNVIELDSGGTFRIELNHKHNEDIKKIFGEMNNDNQILSVAINLALEKPDDLYTLVSNDSLMIAKADSLRLKLHNDGLSNFNADVYNKDRLIDSAEYIHKGKHTIYLKEQILNELFQNKKMDYEQFIAGVCEGEGIPKLDQDVFVGDFFICKHPTKQTGSFVGRLVMQGERKVVRKLYTDVPTAVKGISPKNLEQKMALDLLLDKETSLVCIIGKAGTGKTLLALAAALFQVEEKRTYENVLVARPIVEMGKGIGYLPGEMEEKLRPWMQPIYDNLDFILRKNRKEKRNENPRDKKVESLKDKKDKKELEKKDLDLMLSRMPHLEVEPLTYIRGRSIPDEIFIIDEAQNLTVHEAKTIVTRAGEGAKIILIGDPEQIDNKFLDSVNNGLTYVTEKMKGESFTGVIKLEKTERSLLAERAAALL